jgi:phosphopantothenoylcysteine decarboxylase
MNTAMWQHPITAQHIIILKTFGYNLIMPIHKKLACGDIGKNTLYFIAINQ